MQVPTACGAPCPAVLSANSNLGIAMQGIQRKAVLAHTAQMAPLQTQTGVLAHTAQMAPLQTGGDVHLDPGVMEIVFHNPTGVPSLSPTWHPTDFPTGVRPSPKDPSFLFDFSVTLLPPFPLS